MFSNWNILLQFFWGTDITEKKYNAFNPYYSNWPHALYVYAAVQMLSQMNTFMAFSLTSFFVGKCNTFHFSFGPHYSRHRGPAIFQKLIFQTRNNFPIMVQFHFSITFDMVQRKTGRFYQYPILYPEIRPDKPNRRRYLQMDTALAGRLSEKIF